MKRVDDFRLQLGKHELVPIMIGGMGAMAPERRSDILSLGFKSIVAGTIATCMTAALSMSSTRADQAFCR